MQRQPDIWDLQNEAIGQFMAGLLDGETLSRQLHEIQRNDLAWVFWNMDVPTRTKAR